MTFAQAYREIVRLFPGRTVSFTAHAWHRAKTNYREERDDLMFNLCVWFESGNDIEYWRHDVGSLAEIIATARTWAGVCTPIESIDAAAAEDLRADRLNDARDQIAERGQEAV